jgi:hypothetical protein
MRRAARTDRNQSEIIQALRRAGCRVHDTSRLGGGFPDIMVAGRRGLVLMEIKDGAKPPSARKLTPAEAEFFEFWAEHVSIVATVEQALAAAGVEVS